MKKYFVLSLVVLLLSLAFLLLKVNKLEERIAILESQAVNLNLELISVKDKVRGQNVSEKLDRLAYLEYEIKFDKNNETKYHVRIEALPIVNTKRMDIVIDEKRFEMNYDGLYFVFEEDFDLAKSILVDKIIVADKQEKINKKISINDLLSLDVSSQKTEYFRKEESGKIIGFDYKFSSISKDIVKMEGLSFIDEESLNSQSISDSYKEEVLIPYNSSYMLVLRTIDKNNIYYDRLLTYYFNDAIGVNKNDLTNLYNEYEEKIIRISDDSKEYYNANKELFSY